MLIFLDFDGVLHPDFCSDSDYFCWMDNLETALHSFPNTKIVISSSWREHHTLNSLQQLFPSSLREKIIGVTPVMYDKSYVTGGRELEILLWLQQEQCEHESWIAIDDTLNLFDLHANQVMECDSMVGLDESATQQLIQLLNQHYSKM